MGSEMCIRDSITDHRPLLGTFTKPLEDIKNARLLRLRERTVDFMFDVVWRPGKEHLIADALSRAPLFHPSDEDNKL